MYTLYEIKVPKLPPSLLMKAAQVTEISKLSLILQLKIGEYLIACVAFLWAPTCTSLAANSILMTHTLMNM